MAKSDTDRLSVAKPDVAKPDVAKSDIDKTDIEAIKFHSIDRSIFASIEFHLGTDDTPVFIDDLCYDKVTLPRGVEEFADYHIKNNDYTPFQYCAVTFYLEAPIFVFRELFRSRFANITEKSLRLSDSITECYIPRFLESEGNEEILRDYKLLAQQSFSLYTTMLESGYKKEEASAILPLGMLSKAWFSIDVGNLFHLFDEQLQKTAQGQIRLLVLKMKSEFATLFPKLAASYDRNREDHN